MYINKAMVFGNLTRDPEMRALPSGGSVTSFSIATNRTFKKADGSKQEDVQFHNIVVFGKQAETCAQYLKKGSSAYVEGRLQTRTWDSDKGKQYRTEILAEVVQFGPRSAGAGAGAAAGGSYDGGGDVEPASVPPFGGTSSGSKPAREDAIDYPQEDINPDDIPF